MERINSQKEKQISLKKKKFSFTEKGVLADTEFLKQRQIHNLTPDLNNLLTIKRVSLRSKSYNSLHKFYRVTK